MTDNDFDGTYHDIPSSQTPRGRVESALASIVDQFGAGLFHRPERLKLHLDQACADAPREVAQVLAGLDAEVPQRLLAVHTDAEVKGLLPHLVKRLVERARFERSTATWVVRAWTHALALPVTSAAKPGHASATVPASPPLDLTAIVRPRTAPPTTASAPSVPTAAPSPTPASSVSDSPPLHRDLGALDAATVPRGRVVKTDEAASTSAAREPASGASDDPAVARPTDTFWIIDPVEPPAVDEAMGTEVTADAKADATDEVDAGIAQVDEATPRVREDDITTDDAFVATEPERVAPADGPADAEEVRDERPIEASIDAAVDERVGAARVDDVERATTEHDALGERTAIPVEPASTIAAPVMEQPVDVPAADAPREPSVDEVSAAKVDPIVIPATASRPPASSAANTRTPTADAINWNAVPPKSNTRNKALAIGAAVIAIAIVVIAARWTPRSNDDSARTAGGPASSASAPAAAPAAPAPQAVTTSPAAPTTDAAADVPRSAETPTATTQAATSATTPASTPPSDATSATVAASSTSTSDAPATAAMPSPDASSTPPASIVDASAPSTSTPSATSTPAPSDATPADAAPAAPVATSAPTATAPFATIARVDVPRVTAGQSFALGLELTGDASRVAAVERRVVAANGRWPAEVTITPLSALKRGPNGSWLVPVRAPDAASTATLQLALVDRKGVRSAPRRVTVRVDADRSGRSIAVECTRATCGSVVAIRDAGPRQYETIVRLDDRSIHTFVQSARWRTGARVQKVGNQFVVMSDR